MAKEHTGTRLEPEEVARIDALIEPMGRPGFEMTRSRVIRVLLLRGLEAEERERGTRSKAKGGGK
jgi:hypothetical protein